MSYDPLFEGWVRNRQGRVQSGTEALAEERDELILAACTPKQRAYVLDPSERFAALTCRGAGKTTAARARLVRKALKVRRARLLFIATTKEQAEELMWGPLKELLERLGVGARYNETKLRCTIIETGAVILLVGADDKRTIEKLRGRPFHEVIVDEAASYPIALLSNLLERIIGPRLGDYDGVLGLQGTPGHVLNGQFYEVTRNGSKIGLPFGTVFEADPEDDLEEGDLWSVHRWNLQDQMAAGVRAAFGLWAKALKEKRRNGWGDRHAVWLREYCGIWAADDTEMMYRFRAYKDEENGEPFNIWDPPREGAGPNMTGWAVLPPAKWRYGIGMDMGHGTPFALQVLAYQPSDPLRQAWQVFEFVKRGMYARAIAQLMLGPDAGVLPLTEVLKKPGGIVGRIGWPDFMVADLANLGDAIVLELAEVYGIRIETAEKRDKPGAVELVNGDLTEQRLWILRNSVAHQQMAQLQWRVDEFGLLREPKHGDDATDGIIYARRAIASGFSGEERAAGPVFPARVDPIVEGEKPPTVSDGFELLSDGSYYDETQEGFGSW